MKKLNLDQLKTMIVAILVLVIGVLFCCSLAIGIGGISIIVGLVLLVLGVAMVVNSILGNKSVYSHLGILGCVAMSMGISFLAYKLAGIIFLCIPWFLMVAGFCMILDGILCRFVFGVDGNVAFAIKLVLGIITFVLGLCLQLIDGFGNYASVMLGVLMIVLAIYMLVKIVTNDKQLVE